MPTVSSSDRQTAALIAGSAAPLEAPDGDFSGLLEAIGDARFVLLGEASHGTQEFYRARAAITRRLIEEKGFSAVALEADWPDAYRVNRYVRGASQDSRPEDSLRGFRRFPQWMWRNTTFHDFVGWLQQYNSDLAAEARVGIFGLDLYSLYTSIEAVIQYLEEVDPEGAGRARERYACFGQAGQEAQVYAQMVDLGLTPDCEEEAIRQLLDLRQRAASRTMAGSLPDDEYFFAEQNARLVINAEEYYRTMFRGMVPSWNLRDQHMAETLDALAEHLGGQGRLPKVVVWEHNSHIGDARATQMGRMGELNVGQLAREAYGNEACLIGFTTHSGTVRAASAWDGEPEEKAVRPGMAGSYERLFHEAGVPAFWLRLNQRGEVRDALMEDRLERAIGVIYRPETERQSHYFDASISRQFDLVVHFDETRAVEPLPAVEEGDAFPPDTFPSGY